MHKIKFLSALIFFLSILLAFYSKNISDKNEINLQLLKIINEQKAFTQEISKNIFYIYKNKDASTKQLNNSMKSFIENMSHKEEILSKINEEKLLNQVQKIITLWSDFHALVVKFEELNKLQNPYTNITLEVLVKKIYNINLALVKEFDKLIKMHKVYFDSLKENSRNIQITLFVILLSLLIYLFTQLKDLILFIQKFLQTSKGIIQKSTVKGLKQIDEKPKVSDVSSAVNDFNFFVDKIVTSIDHSTLSIQNSSNSLEIIEKNIENLLELIAEMEENDSLDKELIKKEDILIEALDELSSSLQKLQTIKTNLINFKK